MRKIVLAVAAPALLLLQACSSMTVGSDQFVAVATDPPMQATCKLENGHGRWVVARTPGTALVQGAASDLAVSCTAPGGWHGRAALEARVNPATLGNTVVGGTLGTVTDMMTGAAFEYHHTLTVPMTRD